MYCRIIAESYGDSEAIATSSVSEYRPRPTHTTEKKTEGGGANWGKNERTQKGGGEGKQDEKEGKKVSRITEEEGTRTDLRHEDRRTCGPPGRIGNQERVTVNRG